MKENAQTDWLVDHPFILIYAAFLFVGSLFALYHLFRQETLEKRIGKIPLSSWKINPTDFTLFICCLVAWGAISGPLFVQFYQLVFKPEGELGNFAIIFAGLILQLGMLFIFLKFRFQFRSIEDRPINENPHPTSQSLFLGFIYFLASFPIIILVGMIWNGVLEVLRQFGFEINLPLQETIVLFQNVDHPIELVGLFMLAVIVAPIVEEFVFRAGIYRFFRGRFSVAIALLISGTLFGLVHGNLNSLPGLITVGICLAFAYENTRDIKVPMTFHALFNLNSIIWIFLIPENAMP